jgi:hypothetical protein
MSDVFFVVQAYNDHDKWNLYLVGSHHEAGLCMLSEEEDHQRRVSIINQLPDPLTLVDARTFDFKYVSWGKAPERVMAEVHAHNAIQHQLFCEQVKSKLTEIARELGATDEDVQCIFGERYQFIDYEIDQSFTYQELTLKVLK